MNFFVGQRIEYEDNQSPRIYTGTITRWAFKRYYAFIEAHGKQWLVRADRLKHIGTCQRRGKAA
jgi:hypothetical protein